MPARDLKGALGTSIKAEEAAVKRRFERADTLLTQRESVSPLPARQENGHPNGIPPVEETRVKRDSFTMPVTDHERIAALQKRCLKAEVRASKSEVLRAGLTALASLSDEELAAVIASLPRVKTGRPPGSTT